MMSRRAFLGGVATTVAGSVAGCSVFTPTSCACRPPPLYLRLSSTRTAADLARQASTVLTDRGRAVQIPILQNAVDGGTTVYATHQPIETRRPTVLDGTVYELRHEKTASNVSNGYEIASPDRPMTDGQNRSGSGSVVDFADLPPQDRAALGDLEHRLSLFLPANAYEDPRIHAYEDGTAESVFVPEQQFDVVRFDGEEVPVRVEPIEDGHEYTYTATRRGTLETYGRSLRQEFGFELTDLSEAEHSVLADAIDDGSYVEPGNEPFRSIVGRLFEHEPVFVIGDRAEWPVKWHGTTYWVVFELNSGETDGRYRAQLERYRSTSGE